MYITPVSKWQLQRPLQIRTFSIQGGVPIGIPRYYWQATELYFVYTTQQVQTKLFAHPLQHHGDYAKEKG